MKDNDINQLIDRLQGFDSDALRDEMTDGLEGWCGRRQRRAVAAKRVLVIGLLLLTSTAIAMTTLPLLRPSAPAREVASDGPAARPAVVQQPDVQHSDEEHTLRMGEEQPVEYHYTGVAEDGYSVAYGHDTRTLTYTRYSGSHLISSVVHDAPDDLIRDLAGTTAVSVDAGAEMPTALHSVIACDFQSIGPSGDALYYTVTDSLRRTVSVRGDVAVWMGQRIRYGDTLALPTAVEHEGIIYSVTAVADSAFAGHDELHTVVLPATIEWLGDRAFAECEGMERLVVFSQVPPKAAPATFDRTDAGLQLTVPCGSREAYEDDVEWIYFRNVNEDCVAFPNPHAPRIRVVRR